MGTFEISRVSVSTMDNCKYFIQCLDDILSEQQEADIQRLKMSI